VRSQKEKGRSGMTWGGVFGSGWDFFSFLFWADLGGVDSILFSP